MTQTTLGKLKDNQEFKRNKKSKVTYTVIKKDKRSITFTSNNSPKSFEMIGRTVVFID
jgi:hypothetical protein